MSNYLVFASNNLGEKQLSALFKGFPHAIPKQEYWNDPIYVVFYEKDLDAVYDKYCGRTPCVSSFI